MSCSESKRARSEPRPCIFSREKTSRVAGSRSAAGGVLGRPLHDGGARAGDWKQYLHLAFARVTGGPGYRFGDLRAFSVPTLILVGDRDDFCQVEDGAVAFRTLERGELAILPNTGHVITEAKVRASIEFLRRSG